MKRLLLAAVLLAAVIPRASRARARSPLNCSPSPFAFRDPPAAARANRQARRQPGAVRGTERRPPLPDSLPRPRIRGPRAPPCVRRARRAAQGSERVSDDLGLPVVARLLRRRALHLHA